VQVELAPGVHTMLERAVIEHYNRGAIPHGGLDPKLKPLGLQEHDIDDLVALLESLTGDNIDLLIGDARSERIGNPGND
jgi:cytochrome c peroxidase